MEKVLVLEDEPRVRDFIRKALEQAGMSVHTAANLGQLETYLAQDSFDVFVLDRLIHTTDIIHAIPELKRSSPQSRIIVLSALHSLGQKVEGFELGADDYLGKPFHVDELVARVRSLARRNSMIESGSTKLIQVKDLTIDLQSHRVIRDGKVLELTFKEFRMLVALASEPTKLFSRMELLQMVWGLNFDPESNVVDVLIGRLRRKLNTPGLEPLIQPKRGIGYCLIEEHESTQ